MAPPTRETLTTNKTPKFTPNDHLQENLRFFGGFSLRRKNEATLDEYFSFKPPSSAASPTPPAPNSNGGTHTATIPIEQKRLKDWLHWVESHNVFAKSLLRWMKDGSHQELPRGTPVQRQFQKSVKQIIYLFGFFVKAIWLRSHFDKGEYSLNQDCERVQANARGVIQDFERINNSGEFENLLTEVDQTERESPPQHRCLLELGIQVVLCMTWKKGEVEGDLTDTAVHEVINQKRNTLRNAFSLSCWPKKYVGKGKSCHVGLPAKFYIGRSRDGSYLLVATSQPKNFSWDNKSSGFHCFIRQNRKDYIRRALAEKNFTIPQLAELDVPKWMLGNGYQN